MPRSDGDDGGGNNDNDAYYQQDPPPEPPIWCFQCLFRLVIPNQLPGQTLQSKGVFLSQPHGLPWSFPVTPGSLAPLHQIMLSLVPGIFSISPIWKAGIHSRLSSNAAFSVKPSLTLLDRCPFFIFRVPQLELITLSQHLVYPPSPPDPWGLTIHLIYQWIIHAPYQA